MRLKELNILIESVLSWEDVGRDIYSYGTRITSLPKVLEVGGDLDLRGTPLAKKGKISHPGVKGKIIQ